MGLLRISLGQLHQEGHPLKDCGFAVAWRYLQSCFNSLGRQEHRLLGGAWNAISGFVAYASEVCQLPDAGKGENLLGGHALAEVSRPLE
jgi:hypothetical protein